MLTTTSGWVRLLLFTESAPQLQGHATKKTSISAMFTLHTQEFWKILSFPRIDIFENTTKKLS